MSPVEEVWHELQAAWRIAQVLRIEAGIEGAADHAVGHAVLA
jgi:hypothetical protein